MKILKSRIFLVLVSVILATTITAYATISPDSESIIYDNTNSGITATNLQDAIDELYEKANNSGSGVVEAPTLLWTNENPTAAFAAQTINLDLSNYSSIVFELDNSSQSAYSQKSTYVIKRGTGTIYTVSTVNDNYSTILNSRKVTITDTGISFGGGYHSSGTSASTSNTWTIPLKIYGLKTGVSASTSEAPTLLWENPDLNSTSFGTLDITVDISDYSWVLVKTKDNGYFIGEVSGATTTNGYKVYITMYNFSGVSGSTGYYQSRSIYQENNSNVLKIAPAYNSNKSTTVPTYLVPLQIYGYKNELHFSSENNSETPTLLWTNPNPTATFAPQTLNIDTSEYSCLMFKVMSLINSEAYGHVYYIVNPIEVGIAQLLGTTYGGNSVGTGGRYSRMYIVKSDGSLEFSRGEGDGTANNNFSVPLEIYGLKNNIFPEE